MGRELRATQRGHIWAWTSPASAGEGVGRGERVRRGAPALGRAEQAARGRMWPPAAGSVPRCWSGFARAGADSHQIFHLKWEAAACQSPLGEQSRGEAPCAVLPPLVSSGRIRGAGRRAALAFCAAVHEVLLPPGLTSCSHSAQFLGSTAWGAAGTGRDSWPSQWVYPSLAPGEDTAKKQGSILTTSARGCCPTPQAQRDGAQRSCRMLSPSSVSPSEDTTRASSTWSHCAAARGHPEHSTQLPPCCFTWWVRMQRGGKRFFLVLQDKMCCCGMPGCSSNVSGSPFPLHETRLAQNSGEMAKSIRRCSAPAHHSGEAQPAELQHLSHVKVEGRRSQQLQPG